MGGPARERAEDDCESWWPVEQVTLRLAEARALDNGVLDLTYAAKD